MARTDLQELAEELCRIFLGWKLGEDHDALLALDEGALSIDVLTRECSCDGDPIPSLFIAGELNEWLLRSLERAGVARESVDEARVEALFARRVRHLRGREVEGLRLACRSRIACGRQVGEAEANNG